MKTGTCKTSTEEKQAVFEVKKTARRTNIRATESENYGQPLQLGVQHKTERAADSPHAVLSSRLADALLCAAKAGAGQAALHLEAGSQGCLDRSKVCAAADHDCGGGGGVRSLVHDAGDHGRINAARALETVLDGGRDGSLCRLLGNRAREAERPC